MDALDPLTEADLAALAAALRSGRLHAPYTAVAVRRFCGPDPAAAVAAWLQRQHDDGMPPRHLALVAEAVAHARARLAPAAEAVDLVWTGPEAPGVRNRDTGVVVRDLFGAADAEVLVAGFAVAQGRDHFRPLAERMAQRPGLRVRLFLDVPRRLADAAPEAAILRRFRRRFAEREWPGGRLPELYYDPRSLAPGPGKRSSLHAKCVVVDRRVAFVTSANFTEAAQTRNLEVGALIRCDRFAAQLAGHFAALVEVGALRPLAGDEDSP
jgi:hypothetical protein